MKECEKIKTQPETMILSEDETLKQGSPAPEGWSKQDNVEQELEQPASEHTGEECEKVEDTIVDEGFPDLRQEEVAIEPHITNEVQLKGMQGADHFYLLLLLQP